MLEINQTFAKIGIDRVPEQLSIETRSAALRLSSKQAKINVHVELPKVQIDNYPAFASAGLRNNGDLISLAAQKGYQQVMTFIEKTAADGKTLAAIETGANAVAAIAKRDSMKEAASFDYYPNPGPNITVKGNVQVQADDNSAGVNNGVEGEYVPGVINIDFIPSKVRIMLAQYASISFNYRSNVIDEYI